MDWIVPRSVIDWMVQNWNGENSTMYQWTECSPREMDWVVPIRIMDWIVQSQSGQNRPALECTDVLNLPLLVISRAEHGNMFNLNGIWNHLSHVFGWRLVWLEWTLLVWSDPHRELVSLDRLKHCFKIWDRMTLVELIGSERARAIAMRVRARFFVFCFVCFCFEDLESRFWAVARAIALPVWKHFFVCKDLESRFWAGARASASQAGARFFVWSFFVLVMRTQK